MPNWTKRYQKYAANHGLDPNQMLLVDLEKWEGGMLGYLLWIQEAQQQFCTARTLSLREMNQEKFDLWLDVNRPPCIMFHI